MALKKMCLKCGALISISEKYCQKCRERYLEEKKQTNKIYDERYRDKRSTKFYHSKSWLIVREQIRRRDNGLCKMCLEHKRIKSMDIVHHIEEIKDNYSKRLDKDNLISVCSKCHNTIHGEYDKGNKEEIQKRLKGMIG